MVDNHDGQCTRLMIDHDEGVFLLGWQMVAITSNKVASINQQLSTIMTSNTAPHATLGPSRTFANQFQRSKQQNWGNIKHNQQAAACHGWTATNQNRPRCTVYGITSVDYLLWYHYQAITHQECRSKWNVLQKTNDYVNPQFLLLWTPLHNPQPFEKAQQFRGTLKLQTFGSSVMIARDQSLKTMSRHWLISVNYGH